MKTSEALEKAEGAVAALADVLRWSAARENTWIIPFVAKALDEARAVVNNLRGIMSLDGDR